RPIRASAYQFFTRGGHASGAIEGGGFRFHDGQRSASVQNAADFAARRNMTQFNAGDLSRLGPGVEMETTIEPLDGGFPFGGRIWLLTDRGTVAAGEMAALEAMSSGFAVTVGDATQGVMRAEMMYVLLPNSRISYRIDVGYLTDAQGRSLAEFGVLPHRDRYRGMDALETARVIIMEQNGFVFEVPDNLTFGK
ncbi:MAG: S41 family peptidase, partial [Treponema sp.]|nr:S41 family peptidase [Treponema sp.]